MQTCLIFISGSSIGSWIRGWPGRGLEPLLSEEEAGEAPQSEYPLSKISVDEESMLISVSAVHVDVLAFAAKSLLHSM